MPETTPPRSIGTLSGSSWRKAVNTRSLQIHIIHFPLLIVLAQMVLEIFLDLFQLKCFNQTKIIRIIAGLNM